MYKSPIEIIEINEIVDDINRKFDKAILGIKAFVNVDMEELIKALKYDGEQNEKDFEELQE